MNPVRLFKRVVLAVIPLNVYGATGARIVIPITSRSADLVSRASHDTLMLAVAQARVAFESTVAEHTDDDAPKTPQPYVE